MQNFVFSQAWCLRKAKFFSCLLLFLKHIWSLNFRKWGSYIPIYKNENEMKLQRHELIFGRLKLTLKWTSMNRRKISIGVPGLYYLSIIVVSANWYSSTTQLKLQYHLSGIKSGTGCGDDKNCVGINSECISLECFSNYKKEGVSKLKWLLFKVTDYNYNI